MMSLDELRAELEEIDRQLLSCVARRQSIAAEIDELARMLHALRAKVEQGDG